MICRWTTATIALWQLNNHYKRPRESVLYRRYTYMQTVYVLYCRLSFSGDRIAIASTDYDWFQSEEAAVVVCQPDDCASNEVRIDGTSRCYTILYSLFDIQYRKSVHWFT